MVARGDLGDLGGDDGEAFGHGQASDQVGAGATRGGTGHAIGADPAHRHELGASGWGGPVVVGDGEHGRAFDVALSPAWLATELADVEATAAEAGRVSGRLS